MERRRRAWWAAALAGLLTVAGQAAPNQPAKPEPGKPDAARVEPPDKRATLVRWESARDAKAGVVRVTLFLTYPKIGVHSSLVGQGTFIATVANCEPAAKMPKVNTLAQPPVADLTFNRIDKGRNLQVVLHLNAPAPCRAFCVPSERKVVLEVSLPAAETKRPRTGDLTGQVISAEFIDTDLRVILEALIAQSGANIVLQPGVVGTYSLSLKNVTLGQALDAMWEAWGLVWTRLPGDIILVGTEADLGKRRVDESLALPVGWSAEELAKVLAGECPDLTPLRDPAALAKDSPLPMRGPLSAVMAARRLVGGLLPKTPGAPPVTPTAKPEVSHYYPRYLGLDAAEREVKARFDALTVTADTPTGRLQLSGARDEVIRARRFIESIDQATEQPIEEGFWLPGIGAESLAALAKTSGLELTVLTARGDETYVWARGKESKMSALRKLATQLAERVARREKPADNTGKTGT